MAALLSFDEQIDRFLGRRAAGDRIKMDGFAVTNTGDERSTVGAQVELSVDYRSNETDAELNLTLLVDVPRLDAGESFGPLTRAFGLPADAQPGDIVIAYRLISDADAGPALQDGATELAADWLQLTPFTNGGDYSGVGHGSRQPWIARGGDDVIFGGYAADDIRAGGGEDRVWGGGGDDVLYGQNKRDVLYGNEGDDTLDGGRGHDFLFGHVGNDELRGGAGRDLLDGAEGDDALNGGGGRDNIIGGAGADRLTGGAGGDYFEFNGADYDGDVIVDFAKGDHMTFRNVVYDEDLARYDQVGDDLVVSPDGEHELTLLNYTADDFNIRQITYEFAD